MKKLAIILSLVCFTAITFGYVVPNWKRPAAQLQWDYAAEGASGVAGFIIYYGVEPRAYTNYVTVSGGTNRTATITNLANSTTYYFTATAVDVFGRESDYSNEVTNTTPVKMSPPGQLKATIVNGQ